VERPSVMRTSFAVLLASLAGFAYSVSYHGYAIKDSHFAPRSFSRVRRAPKDHVLNLKISLKQSKFDELERHLYEISDPHHSRYGQHLTADEVNELIKPSDETVTLVHEWLKEHEVDTDLDTSPAGDWIDLKLPVGVIESLLNTEYSVYRHVDGDEMIRTTKWSLPYHLHDHINTIQPTNSFMRVKKKSPLPETFEKRTPEQTVKFNPDDQAELTPYTPAVAATCNPSLVTPGCLRTFYGTVNYTVQTECQMALCDYLGEVNLRTDVKQYLEMYRPDAVAGADEFKQVSIANGTVQQTPLTEAQLTAGTGVEGNLDAETMLGVAYPLPLLIYSTGGSDPSFKPDAVTPTNTDEPYLAWLAYVLAQPDLPTVISTSYGDDEQTISVSYATTACQQFAQLGARGVSVIFSSGDQGVGASGGCYTNDGHNKSTFLPSFPASCPYVTAVGATYMFNPEVAAFDPRFSIPFSSGGGFSNYFSRPWYQKHAVSEYLASHNNFSQYRGLFNPNGRGIPDIAAQGVNFSTIWNGSVIPVDGTSCSAPTAAAIIALVNDALIANGRSALGFLNPWLYSFGQRAFNDILSGSSSGCNTTGFPAAKGWDAVTGFGSPVRFRGLLLRGVLGRSSSLTWLAVLPRYHQGPWLAWRLRRWLRRW